MALHSVGHGDHQQGRCDERRHYRRPREAKEEAQEVGRRTRLDGGHVTNKRG